MGRWYIPIYITQTHLYTYITHTYVLYTHILYTCTHIYCTQSVIHKYILHTYAYISWLSKAWYKRFWDSLFSHPNGPIQAADSNDSCCCCCSVAQSCPTVCDPMDCSTLGFPIPHYLPDFVQTHVHWVDDAIQPSHPLSLSCPALNLFQHQDLFQWVSSSHQVAKALELQRQCQSFQWIFRTDFL